MTATHPAGFSPRSTRPSLQPLHRAHIRNLFLRLLGVVFLIAFVSVSVQLDVLVGSHGLLPAQAFLDSIRHHVSWIDAPTLFWIDCSDRALHAAAIAGALLSIGLVLNVAPRYCLIALWALYLSFVTVSQDFLSFQWDNLLLESAFFGLFVTPEGVRPTRAPEPHPIAVFLMLWLVFRLQFESGAAKLLSGDPTWRNLSAMVNYYETAPLPTWIGWYAHQMPLWAHQLSALFTFVVELGLPLLLFAPRRIRTVVFLGTMAMQISVIATANYGFFNYLTVVDTLFILDDGHLDWVARRFGRRLSPPPSRLVPAGRVIVLGLLAAITLPVSIVPFSPFLPVGPLGRTLAPVRRILAGWRSVNAYHLFANMTLIRQEVVIEGSSDGVTWLSYEFRYKPGDPDRPPPFVAPHQPRVDFQLWFLLLGGPPRARYFTTLLDRLLHQPRAVASLFSRDPFPDSPPQFLRVQFYRYTFTDTATRRATGAWWNRELLGTSQVIGRDAAVPGRPAAPP